MYRNTLLHSAYIEIKAGGEVKGIMRFNPKVYVDRRIGGYVYDREILAEEQFNKAMKQAALIAMKLSFIHVQLLHLTPFKK